MLRAVKSHYRYISFAKMHLHCGLMLTESEERRAITAGGLVPDAQKVVIRTTCEITAVR